MILIDSQRLVVSDEEESDLRPTHTHPPTHTTKEEERDTLQDAANEVYHFHRGHRMV